MFDGNVILVEDFLINHRELFDELIGLDYFEGSYNMYGKQVPRPRLQQTEPTKCLWTESTLVVKRDIESYCATLGVEVDFNYTLYNLYKTGDNHISWHHDKEAIPAGKDVVASLTLGCARDFQIKKYESPIERKNRIAAGEKPYPITTIELKSGSLLIMKGAFITDYLHRVPKRKGVTKPRLNITFRIT